MFTIGADPEVFVGNSNSVKSIIGLIGGTKDYPKQLPLGRGFAVQEDNVALEYNIPPSDSKEKFIDNITLVMGFLETTLKDAHGLSFRHESAIHFPKEELANPLAHRFGCDPDYNCWTGRRNPKPKAKDETLRSCGGHVHIGNYGDIDARSLIRACDLHLGVPSVLLDDGNLRKELYGKAGAFREKPFGVEYRTLSNFWIFDRSTIDWVYRGVERALLLARHKDWWVTFGDTIVNTINNNDRDTAQKLVKEFALEMV